MLNGKLVLTVLLLTLPASAPAQQIAFAQYEVRYPFSAIAVGSDGALWFTGPASPVGRVTTAGEFTMYPVQDCNGITAGPDGALWVTEGLNRIGRITTGGAITEYPIPNTESFPKGITAGRDGAVWFVEQSLGGNKIGRITTAGVITEYSIAGPTARLGPIVTGTDGALWFTNGYSIVRITTPGSTTVYTLPPTPVRPSALAVGTDGALWFSGQCSIGRINAAGAITIFPLPGCVGYNIQGIAAGADGAMWFTAGSGSQTPMIGRITPAGIVSQYPVPNLPNPAGMSGITIGPDGELWFTDETGIGEAFIVTADLSASPDTGFYRTSHTFTGTGFAPDETVLILTQGIGSAPFATATADSTGSFAVPARLPQSPYGPRVFIGVGQTSRKLGAASFTVTPNILLNPSSGPVGTTVTAEGYGFPPFSQLKIYWSTPGTFLGNAVADANGTFSGSAALTFTVPTAAPSGSNHILGAWQPCTPTSCPNAGYGYFTVE